MWNYRNSGVGYGGLEIYGYDDMDMVDMVDIWTWWIGGYVELS